MSAPAVPFELHQRDRPPRDVHGGGAQAAVSMRAAAAAAAVSVSFAIGSVVGLGRVG